MIHPYKSPHVIDETQSPTARKNAQQWAEYVELRASKKLEYTLRRLEHAKLWNARLFIFSMACLSAALYQVLKASGWSPVWFCMCLTANVVIFFWFFADITRKISKS